MSKARPSVFPAWAACACFDSKDEPGEAAQRGTIQHEHLERMLKGIHNGGLSMLEPAEAEGVIWAAGYIKDWCAALEFPIESEVPIEYYASEDDFAPLYDGTADAICSSNLFDLKTGDPHDYEYQMYAYALGMFQRADKAGQTLESVTCHLMYSRVRSAVRFLIQRDVAEAAIKEVLARRANPERTPRACSFCKWCTHAAYCGELNTAALAVAAGREDFKLENYHASEIVKPEEMAKALRMARFISAWCDAIEHHAKEMAIKNGEIIPGFCVSKKSGNRSIKDAVKAWELAEVTPSTFLKCCSVKIGELEKTIGKKAMAEKLESVISRGGDVYFLTEEKTEKPKAEQKPAYLTGAEDIRDTSAQPTNALDTDF